MTIVCRSRWCGRKGVTLIELLIVIALFSIISVSLFLALQTGLLLYKRSEEGLSRNHEVLLMFQQLERDLRNVMPYTPVPFEGDEKTMSFPTITTVYSDDGMRLEPAHVSYSLKGNELARVEILLNDSDKKEMKQSVLATLADPSFAYGVWEEEDEELTWIQSFPDDDAEGMPRAVRMRCDVVYTDDDGTSTRKSIEKKVWLPSGT